MCKRQNRHARKVKIIDVFDFEERGCMMTANTIRMYFKTRNEHVMVREFTSTEIFVEQFNQKQPDAAFVTVNNMLGVETARIIRDISPYCPLFLVSDVCDYGIEGFRLHALDYLIKPVTGEMTGQALSRVRMPCLKHLVACNED